MFDEFIKEITKELEAKESRSRARSAAPHARFKYAVSFLIPNYPAIGTRT